MNRLVIALSLFFVVPFVGFSQCPIPEDTLTDKFGNTWKGKISGESVWPTIKIDEPGRGRYGANFNELTKLVWEGVTNAKECYHDPGMRAFQDARSAWSSANPNSTNPNPDKLIESRTKYQEAIDFLSKIQPQADDLPKYQGQFLFQQGQKHIEAAEKMVPKLNSALHFNDGFRQFQQAMGIKDKNEIGTARSLFAESKANFGTAIEDFNKAILKGVNNKEDLRVKVGQARKLVEAGDKVSNWLERTNKLFSPDDLKNAPDFTLNNLIDNIEIDRKDWDRLNDEEEKILNGRLGWIHEQHAERRETSDSIVIFRDDLKRVEQECKILLSGIPNQIGQEDYEGAQRDVADVGNNLDRIEQELEYANADEEGRLQALRDQSECFRKEIDFRERVVQANRDLQRGERSEQNHKQTTAAKEEFEDLIDDANNVEALCADKAWVAKTIEESEAQLVIVEETMKRQEWIPKDGEYLAPIHENFQAMLNSYTSTDLSGTNLERATYFHPGGSGRQRQVPDHPRQAVPRPEELRRGEQEVRPGENLLRRHQTRRHRHQRELDQLGAQKPRRPLHPRRPAVAHQPVPVLPPLFPQSDREEAAQQAARPRGQPENEAGQESESLPADHHQTRKTGEKTQTHEKRQSLRQKGLCRPWRVPPPARQKRRGRQGLRTRRTLPTC